MKYLIKIKYLKLTEWNIKLNSLPWYLNLNINNVRNLFSQIELPYEIDCYICVCGHNEIIIKGQNSILEKYTCIHCENTNFYNANVLNNNYSWYEPIYNLFNENYLFSISPTISYDENTNTICIYRSYRTVMPELYRTLLQWDFLECNYNILCPVELIFFKFLI